MLARSARRRLAAVTRTARLRRVDALVGSIRSGSASARIYALESLGIPSRVIDRRGPGLALARRR